MNNDEMFMSYIFNLTNNKELTDAIMQIHDVVYGDGSPSLNVDETYQDASVETEARPKNDTTLIYQPLNGNPGMDLFANIMSEQRQAYRDRVFNPIETIIRDRPKSEIERLMTEPVESNVMYNRW